MSYWVQVSEVSDGYRLTSALLPIQFVTSLIVCYWPVTQLCMSCLIEYSVLVYSNAMLQAYTNGVMSIVSVRPVYTG